MSWQFMPCLSGLGNKLATAPVHHIVAAAERKDGPPERRRGQGGRRGQHSRSGKGASFSNSRRRRGRPAWTRSPDDTPFRDGNRDRVIGLLTQRAARTLAFYLSETNISVYSWLAAFMHENPIPKDGAWDDVSGETFLRKLLGQPVQSTQWMAKTRENMYSNFTPIGVDPRSIAQRIMEIRVQLAKEWTQDLSEIAEENSYLLRESLMSSLSINLENTAPHSQTDSQPPP